MKRLIRSTENSDGNFNERDSTVLFQERSIFIGRDTDKNNIIKYLETSLNTQDRYPAVIWGIGGMGKSMLAKHAIYEFLKKHAEVKLIEIDFESKPAFDDMLDIIRNQLEILDIGSYQDPKIKIEKLNKKLPESTLFYLDAFELVSSPDPDYKAESIEIKKYLDNLPLKIMTLVTSRNKTNHLIKEKEIVCLHELDTDNAINLFSQITNLDKKENQKIMEKIVSFTGNTPLYIEILAHNYFGEGLKNFYENLNKNTLTIENPDPKSMRQSSMNSCIEYSYRKLPENHKILLKNLAQLESIFSSNISSVFSATVGDLQYLYDRGMLRHQEKYVDGDYLYDFHKVVKDYFLDKSKNENIKNQKNIIDWKSVSKYYLEFLQNTYNSLQYDYDSKQVQQLDLLVESEVNDFTKLAEFTDIEKINSIFSFVWIGLIFQTRENFSRALEYYEHALMLLLHDTITYDHNNDKILERLESYLKILKINDKQDIDQKYEAILAKICANIGNVLMLTVQFDLSLKYHDEAIRRHQKLGNILMVKMEHVNKGIVLMYQGDLMNKSNEDKKTVEIAIREKYKQAESEYEIALKSFSDKAAIAKIYANLGILYFKMSFVDKSIEHHKEAINLYASDDLIGKGKYHINYGNVLDMKGNHKDARNEYQKALVFFRKLHHESGIGTYHTNMGFSFSNDCDFVNALDEYDKALEKNNALGKEIMVAKNLKDKSNALFELGLKNDSDTCHQQAEKIHYENNNEEWMNRKVQHWSLASVFDHTP